MTPPLVGIIGAGLIGQKRFKAIQNTGLGTVVAVADASESAARALAGQAGCESFRSADQLLARGGIDAVIVAVPNAFAPAIVLSALSAGAHVLCEKPFGTSASEAERMVAAAAAAGRLVKVGFNHRFHAGIRKAKELFDAGEIGKPLFIRARYGHGGRLGMEAEWRFQKEISGGGELLDQGVHIIDLCRWFAGEFTSAYGIAETKFWKIELDDNAFALVRNAAVTASFHVSTTNWKNIFSFEVFGDTGFLAVEGKGGSYGEETLTVGKRLPQFGVPTIEKFSFSGDTSWDEEWRGFVGAITGERVHNASDADGLAANRIVEAIYESSRTGRTIDLGRT